jgi:hypothetical protein
LPELRRKKAKKVAKVRHFGYKCRLLGSVKKKRKIFEI